MLLPRDRYRLHLAGVARVPERSCEGVLPVRRIGLPRPVLARDDVGRATLGDDPAIVRVDDDDLGGLRGAVDTCNKTDDRPLRML